MYYNNIYISRDFSLPLAIEMYGRPFCFRAIPTKRVLSYSLILFVQILLITCINS